MIKIKFLIIILISFILLSCNTTSPGNVKKTEAQKITSIDYGYIISSMPVDIKGEGSVTGATAGALIGGLLGTQVCGEEKIVGNKCQDVAVFYATISGAVLGYATEALMGNHDGFQYVIDVDNQEDDVAIIQGDEEPLANGERIVILYGDNIRVTLFDE